MTAKTEPTSKIYYSAKDCGFLFLAERAAYDAAGTWPSDAVEVTEEEWRVFGQQPPPAGMRRGSDDLGRPAWIKPVVSEEDVIAQERAWRGRELTSTDSLVSRHRDQVESASPTSLSTEEYQELQRYRSELRDWPNRQGFPDALLRPEAPVWLRTAVQQ